MAGLMVRAVPSAADAVHHHRRAGTIGVHLFGQGSPALPGLGSRLAEFTRRDLPSPPSQASWDFLSIALAVFAADRFVPRSPTADTWTRLIGLDVAVADPAAWQPVLPTLAAALRFLTGDIWYLSLSGGGAPAPAYPNKPHDRDVVCLFSGGLDSFLGALDLANAGDRPLLVSQGATKEIGPQQNLAAALRLNANRFEGRASERWRPPYEGSTRSRSILFFAYGAVAASAAGLGELLVPENALIAINPPFTRRRPGSLSTRTVHPHFLRLLNRVWLDAGVGVTIRNPYFATTKGEMLGAAVHPRLSELASRSYSCGKGKRKNGQCGRCVPCIIRRASFNASGVADVTRYLASLRDSARNDDVLAARQAVARFEASSRLELERWVRQAGPLSEDRATKDATVDAVGRGLAEVRDLLDTVRWP